jgi:hypothetical protein
MSAHPATNFAHFIITQFNLRNFPRSSNAAYDDWVAWTRARIGLFEAYCLPSVLQQRNRNFRWLLFFDQETPAEFMPFIEKWGRNELVEICYSNGTDDFYASYIDEIKFRMPTDCSWLITSRIDNDDCIHQDYVDRVQQYARFRHRYMVSLASGYTLDLNKKRLSHYFYPSSPFISLVESTSERLMGVHCKGHSEWNQLRLWVYRELRTALFAEKQRMTSFVLDKPLWIQVIHGKNVSNSFYRGLPVIREKTLQEFGLEMNTQAVSLKKIGKYFHYVIWKRYLKCLTVKLLVGNR